MKASECEICGEYFFEESLVRCEGCDAVICEDCKKSTEANDYCEECYDELDFDDYKKDMAYNYKMTRGV